MEPTRWPTILTGAPEHPQGTEAEGVGSPIISGCVYPKRCFLDYSTEKTRGLGPTGEEAASAITRSRASAPWLPSDATFQNSQRLS